MVIKRVGSAEVLTFVKHEAPLSALSVADVHPAEAVSFW